MFLPPAKSIISGVVQIENPDFRPTPPTSHPCTFFQSGPFPLKVCIFEEISTSTFQKYIVLLGGDVCEKSCDRLKTIEFERKSGDFLSDFQ
jgi:hypothetical protein